MKKKIISMALIYGLSTFAIANAAEVSDVPADHWAYPAVKALVKDGIIDGFNDGTFKGDKALTRYEMAQIVEKAVKNSQKATVNQKILIDKLASEFALEINNIDVRVKKVEEKQAKLQEASKKSLTVKFDATNLGWTADNPAPQYSKYKMRGTEQFTTRFRLMFSGDIAGSDNISFNGRLTSGYEDFGTPGRDSSNQGLMSFDRVNFTFKNTFGCDRVVIGRQLIFPENTGTVIYKAGDNDGVTLFKKNGDTNYRAGVYAVKKEDANGGANSVALFSVTKDITPNLRLSNAFLHNNMSLALADNPLLNYSYTKSDVNSFGAVYKMGKWAFSSQYDRAHLTNPVNANRSPYGYSFALSNYPWAPEVIESSPTHMYLDKVGASGWCFAYNYHQAGVVPAGFGTWVTPSAIMINNKIVNLKDGTKGLMVEYQYVIAKGFGVSANWWSARKASNGEKITDAYGLAFVADF